MVWTPEDFKSMFSHFSTLCMKVVHEPANIYLLNSTIETPEKDVKYDQS